MSSATAKWWKDVSSNLGSRFMDKHVNCPLDDSFIASGKADFERAVRKTKIPTSEEYSVLEIGCGLGRMTKTMSQYYKEITAVDISEQFIDWAKSNASSHNVRYRVLDTENLCVLSEEHYDIALSYEVFHYLDNLTLGHYFRAIAERPGRVLYFQINTRPISYKTVISRLVRKILFKMGIEEWNGWPTTPSFFHQVHKPESVSDLLYENGFKKVKVIDPCSTDTWFIASN